MATHTRTRSSTESATTTVTRTRMMMILNQFNEIFLNLPDYIMTKNERKVYLRHIAQQNIKVITLAGCDDEGLCVVKFEYRVDWQEHNSLLKIVPNIEVSADGQILPATALTLEVFYTMLNTYQLNFTLWVTCVRQPNGLTLEELRKQLGLVEATRPLTMKDGRQTVQEHSSDKLHEYSVFCTVVD